MPAGRSCILSASTPPTHKILWLPVQGEPERRLGFFKIRPLVAAPRKPFPRNRADRAVGQGGLTEKASGPVVIATWVTRVSQTQGMCLTASDGVAHPVDDVSQSRVAAPFPAHP